MIESVYSGSYNLFHVKTANKLSLHWWPHIKIDRLIRALHRLRRLIVVLVSLWCRFKCSPHSKCACNVHCKAHWSREKKNSSNNTTQRKPSMMRVSCCVLQITCGAVRWCKMYKWQVCVGVFAESMTRRESYAFSKLFAIPILIKLTWDFN